MEINEALKIEFQKLLNDSNVNENSIQRFLEENSRIFYTPFLFHHGLLYQSVISKLPVSNSLISDFAYLTKNSAEWRLVLVELESPHKTIFRQDTIPTAELTAAINQINSWKESHRKNQDHLRNRISCLTDHRSVDLDIKYVLVIGRNPKEFSDSQKARIKSLSGEDLVILTYDSLLRENMSELKHGDELAPKNVLSVSGEGFKIKHLSIEACFIGKIFNYVKNEYLEISPVQRANLLRSGFTLIDYDSSASPEAEPKFQSAKKDRTFVTSRREAHSEFKRLSTKYFRDDVIFNEYPVKLINGEIVIFNFEISYNDNNIILSISEPEILPDFANIDLPFEIIAVSGSAVLIHSFIEDFFYFIWMQKSFLFKERYLEILPKLASETLITDSQGKENRSLQINYEEYADVRDIRSTTNSFTLQYSLYSKESEL